MSLFEAICGLDEFVCLDLEYINETLGTSVRPGPQHWKEIVQIGAIDFDNKQGQEVRKLDILVNPRVYSSRLSLEQWSAFTDLTGLPKKLIVEHGVDFRLAMKQLLEFISDKPVVVMLGDQDVLKFNANLHRMRIPNLKCTKLKPALVEMNPVLYKPLFSGDLYKVVGLNVHDLIPKEEVHSWKNHNALFDARSMARFIFAMTQRIRK